MVCLESRHGIGRGVEWDGHISMLLTYKSGRTAMARNKIL